MREWKKGCSLYHVAVHTRHSFRTGSNMFLYGSRFIYLLVFLSTWNAAWYENMIFFNKLLSLSDSWNMEIACFHAFNPYFSHKRHKPCLCVMFLYFFNFTL
jgi:hypothetical protein